MTFLDRVVQARAAEQTSKVKWGHYDGRMCWWPGGCRRLVVYWNKSGLCQQHHVANKGRAKPFQRWGA